MTQLLRPGRTIAILTFVLAFGILLVWGGGMFSPGSLNSENKSGQSTGGVRAHADLATNCAACHAAPWSASTMADRCLVCHEDVHQQITSHGPLHGKIPEAANCRKCHTEHQGPHGILTSLEHFHHDYAAFALTGKHVALECSSCHVANHFKGTNQSCVGCHAEPAVHKGKFSLACAGCHSTTTWKGAAVTLTAATFDHDKTHFKLTGKHRDTQCASCHKNNVFSGTAKSCVACHAEPTVHLGKFGVACAGCHTTTTWKGAVVNLNDKTALANFNHDTTGFKLTGKHRDVQCATCHKNNVFSGTAKSCVACHAEPTVHLGKFGVACASCHTTTTWKGAVVNLNDKTALANFDHDATGFKLTGKHKGADCASCHKNGVFKGTAQACVACHVEPKTPQVHKQPYGDKCSMCHSTVSWTDTTFKHSFPINHGNRRGKNAMAGGNKCETCHTNPANFAVYTCYNCHVHEKSRIERIHRGRKIPNLEDCVKCHKTGRSRGDLGTPDRDGLFAFFIGNSDDRPADPIAFLRDPPAANCRRDGAGGCPEFIP